MGISKIMCNGLSDRIPIESIYSASKVGKKSCLERIRQRFGKNVTYVTIGESRRSNETVRWESRDNKFLLLVYKFVILSSILIGILVKPTYVQYNGNTKQNEHVLSDLKRLRFH